MVNADAVRTGAAPTANTSSITKSQFTTPLTLAATSVVSGRPINASIAIVNRTRHSIGFPSCRIDASLLVGIEPAAIPFSPLNGAVGCRTVIRPGVNMFKESIPTTYQGCSDLKAPFCEAIETAPPLPVGTYRTVITWLDVPSVVPHPKPITVVVKARSDTSLKPGRRDRFPNTRAISGLYPGRVTARVRGPYRFTQC